MLLLYVQIHRTIGNLVGVLVGRVEGDIFENERPESSFQYFGRWKMFLVLIYVYHGGAAWSGHCADLVFISEIVALLLQE